MLPERRYLLILEAPPLKQVEEFVCSNIERNVAQFVALASDRVVGWCDVCPKTRDGLTHTGELGMGLAADYRQQGIGSRLLEATIDKAFSNGLERIELEAFSSNRSVITLYEKFGFEHEGIKRKARYIDGIWDDFIIMSLLHEVG